MKLSGWKGWELALLKGAIAVFVFPCVAIAATLVFGLVVSFFLRPVIEVLATRLEAGDNAGFVVAAIVQYVVGIVVAIYVCRRVWPEVETTGAQ